MKLLWDEKGRIACEKHAPYKGTDTWVWDRWRPIRASEWADFQAELGHPPRCETCAALARRDATEAT